MPRAKKQKFERGTFVLITWHDASDPEATWLAESEIKDFSQEHVVVVSEGRVFEQTSHYITLYRDKIVKGAKEPTYSGVTKIPNKMIVSIDTKEFKS